MMYNDSQLLEVNLICGSYEVNETTLQFYPEYVQDLKWETPPENQLNAHKPFREATIGLSLIV